jgi:DNA-binding beta-propeller fold protein YncE
MGLVKLAITADGAHVWVANRGGGSVSEVDAATGAPIQVLTGPSYPFSGPEAIATNGTRIWVADTAADSVTEFPAPAQQPAPRTPAGA